MSNRRKRYSGQGVKNAVALRGTVPAKPPKEGHVTLLGPFIPRFLRRHDGRMTRALFFTAGKVYFVLRHIFAALLWRTLRYILAILVVSSALLGLLYLVADRYYETSATISVSASDPANPFMFPFAVTNNSHIFRITKVRRSCIFHTLFFDNGPHFSPLEARQELPILPEIPEGQTVNFDCGINRTGRPSAFAFPAGKQPRVLQAALTIELGYYVAFFAIEVAHRHASATFTWFGNASNPQWIRGTEAP
jgi:hypothetical protein